MPSKQLLLFINIKDTWFSKIKRYILAPGEHFIGIYNEWLIHLAPILIAYNDYNKCYAI